MPEELDPEEQALLLQSEEIAKDGAEDEALTLSNLLHEDGVEPAGEPAIETTVAEPEDGATDDGDDDWDDVPPVGHPAWLPPQMTHPRGPWGDTPMQARTHSQRASQSA